MVDSGVDNKIDYIAGIEYYNTVTQSIMHSQGRVFYPTPTTPRYEYTISDHLGNARIMYTDLNNDGKVATPTEILWEGQYYPYGLAHKGAWMDTPDKDLNYKYNGIELADDFGLNVNLASFRTLDPATGRWWQVDPKAEAVMSLSPYQSMNNNPISNVDPDGDSPILIGAAIGVLSNGIGNAINGENFFKGAGKAALFGAIGGGISAGIGGVASNMAANGASKFGVAAFQFGAHSASGGLMSAAQGGNFWHGAAAGGFSSGVGSGIDALGGGATAQWLGGGLSGGVGSSIAGGSFWDGARQGLITGGLNHAAHSLENYFSKPDDIIYLLDPQGAGFQGHAAMLIELPDGRWRYISKDGTNNGDVANVTEQTFNSVAEFKAAFPRYNRSIRFQTSAAQDAAALKAATGSSVTKYRFLKNNCGHIVVPL